MQHRLRLERPLAIRLLWALLAPVLLLHAATALAQCPAADRVSLQILGSGGPELSDRRASSSYLIWIAGQARVLVDTGPGSSLNFEHSGARFEDLSAILFSHLHVDHSAALPAYVKGAYFTDRSSDLPIYGPAANERMPATSEFVAALFGPQGAYRYLSDYLLDELPGPFKIRPVDIPLQHEKVQSIQLGDGLQLQTVAVHHGPIAALAWRVNVGSCSIVFSGDMNNRYQSLTKLARDADLLVAHNAIPQSATGAAANLHMKPSQIGEIAREASVKQILLSHRMGRTLGRESATLREVRRYYKGPVSFAEPLQTLTLSPTSE